MMMKQHSSRQSAIAMPVGAMTAACDVDRCVNLIPSKLLGADALTVSPQPLRICDFQLIPLLQLPDSGEWLMYSPVDAENHAELYIGTAGMEPEWLMQVEGEPRCAAASPSGIVVMLPDGPLQLSRSTGNRLVPQKHTSAAMQVSITAGLKGTLTKYGSPVAITLIGSGQSSTPSTDSLQRLSDSLLNAYSSLSTEALSGGVWIQPVGVRYRVLDSDGNELWRSPVSIVGIDGWQCASQISTPISGSSSSYTTSPLHIAAKAYAINVEVPPMQQGNDAATIIVEATPQLHPILPDRLPHTLLSGLNGNSPTLGVWMPGVQRNMEATIATFRMMLQATITGCDALMTRIGRIDLTSTGRTVQLTPQTSDSLDAELSELRSAIDTLGSQETLPDDNTLSRIIATGATFSAGCVVQNGDTTVWGNISTVSGNEALSFPAAADVQSGAWEAAMTISLGASTYTTRHSGSAFCPTSIAPLVAIAQPRATALTVYVKHLGSGTITEASFRLTPTANGLMAYAISSDLRPTPLVQSGLTALPAATANPQPPESMPGAVIAAHSSDPLRAVCGGFCCQSQITALATAVKSQSSWDFSRCHIYAFAPTGIHTVAVNTANGKVTSSRIDPRSVTSPAAVVHTPQGVVAVADSTPVICSASSVRPLPALPPSISSPLHQVAWHSRQQSLYFIDTLGNIIVLHDNQWHHLLLSERVEHIGHSHNGVWLTGTDGSYEVAQEPEECHIQWRTHLTAPLPMAPLTLTVPVAASHFNGTIELRTHSGAGPDHTLPILKLKVDGPVNAPIMARLAAPYRTGLMLHVNGSASGDFHIVAPTLTISTPTFR